MTPDLPRAATMAAWLATWLRGETAPDDLLAALSGGEQVSVLVGLPGADGALSPGAALGLLRSLGAQGASLALPAAGDPVGLAGPPAFTMAALEAGEAVVLEGAGIGLIPVTVGGAVEWRAQAATPAPWLDLAEQSVALRQALVRSTQDLVDLDVTAWQPEIPDALTNLRTRRAPLLPASYDRRRRECIERAALCLEIVGLGREAEHSALSASTMHLRERVLDDLDRAARRALVAACR